MDKAFLGSGLSKLLTINPIKIDNVVFQLHYKFTTSLLIAFSIAASGYQFFGDPIMCINKDDLGKHANNKILNNYCWIEGTFSVVKGLNKTVGKSVPYAGVDKQKPGDELIHHAYYQWVCFVLFFQAGMFYATRLIWKAYEGGKMNDIILKLNQPILALDAKEKAESGVVEYLIEHKGKHSMYALQYFFCEVLNFVNIVGQIFFLNTFLHGEFLTYGSRALAYLRSDVWDDVNPMIKAFPRLTKCTFHRYGPTGGVQLHDAMCVLPLNILNEKIFIFIWVWFIILALLSGLAVVYRVICMFSPQARKALIRAVGSLTPPYVIKGVLHDLRFDDWFMLYLIGNNMDNLHYTEIMIRLNSSRDWLKQSYPESTRRSTLTTV